MTIHSVSNIERKAVVCLSSEELTEICNALCHSLADDDDQSERFFLLYAVMQNARDLSIYGHLDNFSLEYALNCRKQADKIKEVKEHAT